LAQEGQQQRGRVLRRRVEKRHDARQEQRLRRFQAHRGADRRHHCRHVQH
jgi:hypothetical protein